MTTRFPFRDMTDAQLMTILSLLQIEKEPLHGFTTEELFQELHSEHSGSEQDLANRLAVLRTAQPRCCVEDKYWCVPAQK